VIEKTPQLRIRCMYMITKFGVGDLGGKNIKALNQGWNTEGEGITRNREGRKMSASPERSDWVGR